MPLEFVGTSLKQITFIQKPRAKKVFGQLRLGVSGLGSNEKKVNLVLRSNGWCGKKKKKLEDLSCVDQTLAGGSGSLSTCPDLKFSPL